MRKHLHKLFAISMAMALGLGAAAQTFFYATLPSGQSLRFEVTSPTTCQLAGNTSIGGSATDSLIIPYTVSDGTHTYQVTAIGGNGIRSFRGRGTLILPNSITRIEWNGLNNNDFDTIIFPAGLNFMDNGAVKRSDRFGSGSVLVFRSATPPVTTSGYFNAFTNGYTAGAVQHIYVPAGQSAAYQSAFGTAFTSATLHEWGTAPTAVGFRTDTIHLGGTYILNGRYITAAGTYIDSAFFYTHDSLTTVRLVRANWHFSVDTLGNRLWYRIIGTDEVAVVPPNTLDQSYSGYTEPSGNLDIPDTVRHGGTAYAVIDIGPYAFYNCNSLDGYISLPPTIYGINDYAFARCSAVRKIVIPASVIAFSDSCFLGTMTAGQNDTLVFLGSNAFWLRSWSTVFGSNGSWDSKILVPCGSMADYSAVPNIPAACLQEYGCPVVVHIYDTLFYAMGPVTFAGRSITSPGEYRDTIHLPGYDSINILVVSEAHYSFYANAPTGQRLYYRITGTDSVEVVAPNGSGWAYYTPPTDSLAIPATVTHDGHTYSVFRIASKAFYCCDAISALTLSEGISEVGTEAFHIRRTSQELRVSLPRSLRIIEVYAFYTTAFNSRLKLASDTIWAEVIGREAFFPKVISQPLVLPNVRTIGDKGFYRIGLCPYLWVGDSCTSIGEQAFAEITTVPNAISGRISLGTSLQSVGASAFSRPNGRPIHSVEFRGTTVPTFAAGVFKNTQVDSIITPCGTSAAYRAALDAAPVNEDWDPSNTVFQERGCPVNVYLYDTLFYAMGPVTFAGRSITSPGEYRDTIHLPGYDSINILVVSEAHYSFSVDTLGNRLWYRIIGTDRVAVVPPNTLYLSYSGYTEPSGNLDIPDTVRHGGTAYAVVQVGDYAFKQCYSLDGYISLPPTIDTIGYEAFDRCTAVKKLVIPASVNFFNQNCFFKTMTLRQNDTIVFLGSDASRLSTWASMFGSGSSWDSKILVPCGSMAAYSAVRGIPAAYLQEYGCTVVVHIYDTMCVGTTYHWANKAIISGGTFYDTVHRPLYDSVTILHLTTEGNWNMGGVSLPVVYCETSLPFTWRGQNIDAPGDYTSDERVLTPRGCWHSGKKYEMTVFQRPHTYIYDTVRSTAKGYDYSDTTETTVPVNNYPCRDSLVTTITWHDLDETTDTVRTILYDTICAGTIYHFGSRYLIWSDTYYDTVRMPFRDSITVLHLEVEGTMANSLHTEVICETSLPYIWDGDTITTPGTHHLDHSVFNPRGCLMSGSQLQLTVVPRAKTYIYDTVVSTAKGYDYDDTTQVSVLRQGSRNSPCPDSLVTTYTHYDLDESVDTLRVYGSHQQCDGTYLFGGIERTATGTYTDTVVVDPFHVTITTLDLTINYSNTGDTAAVACDVFTWHGVDYTASAAPQHVYTNAAGCDSTVTLPLTVNYSNTGDTAAVVCDAFTWHGVEYTASAAPQHVYTNAAGCDSTVTLALTINYSNTGDTAAVACDAFAWHGTTYTAAAAPQHVYTNAAGCDSTVTLALTINYSNTGDTAAVACDAFTWHGTTYTASAAPQHVYTNAAGCDSTVTLALTINYSNTGDTAAVACDAFSWHGVDYTAAAAPQHVYTNAVGCDSTVTLALTINYSNTGDTAAVACDVFAWHGTTYTASAAPQHVYTNVAGCDSTVTLNLTVRHSNTGDTAAVAFDAFTWYGHTYRATTTATHTLTNAEGCDSTVTLALTILESYSTDAAFGENGIEVEAYGYCAGPGAVRYRLSSGQPNEYRLAFAHAAFPAADWTPITTPGSIDIEVPAGLVTGDYSAVLQFRHSSWPELTSAAIPVVIHVNLPETYVQPLFNDVIALVDTCQCLTDVQWYHREAGETEWTLIPGANDYYYHQEGGLTGEYFVSAKMNGVETYTCPQSDMGTLITDGNITLTAYPNPTASVVTLTLDGSRRASHEVRVLTTTGIELERRSFEGDSLRMDLSAYPRGSYIVSVDGMAVRVIRN